MRGHSRPMLSIRNARTKRSHGADRRTRKRSISMWHAGELSTSHRKNFIKFYDLTERVIPEAILEDERSDEEQVDWLCRAALDRLAFAGDGDIQRFWDAADLPEVKRWSDRVRGEMTAVGGRNGERRLGLAICTRRH